MALWSDSAHKYANDVVAGKVEANKFVKLACQRHLDDLKASKKKTYRWRFDEPSANLPCFFIANLTHIEGDIAGQPIALQPWQCFSICSVYGWVDKENPKQRRFTEVYEEVPRKNSKSTKMAGLALYETFASGEMGAQVFCGATTYKQAMMVFRPAYILAKGNAWLRENFAVTAMKENISCPDTNSKFEPLIGDPGDGSNPSMAIVDEYHEHSDSRLFDTMMTGMGARTSPLLWTITTAGVDIGSPCYEKRDELIKTLEGIYDNDRLFGLIYGIDEDDDWTDFSVWKKANPHYGFSVKHDNLYSRYTEALNRPNRRNILLCKHLNIWANAKAAWLDMRKLKKCADPTLRLEDFIGQPCFVGLDMATVSDLAAKVYLFYKNEHVYAFGEYYLPEATVSDNRMNRYGGWVEQGFITETSGSTTDFSLIKAEIMEDGNRFDVNALAYDPWQATQLAQELDAEGVPVVKYPNQARTFSEPMKQLERWILDGKFHYNGDPVMEWCFSNVTAKTDKKDNIYPDKDVDKNKIDAVVSMIMAAGLLVNDLAKQSSYKGDVWV